MEHASAENTHSWVYENVSLQRAYEITEFPREEQEKGHLKWLLLVCGEGGLPQWKQGVLALFNMRSEL